jgi:large subunit ribosomal protein L19
MAGVASSSWRRAVSTDVGGGGGGGVSREDMPFFHHRRPPRSVDAPPRMKFKSPVKRASKLYAELKVEAVQQSVTRNPKVLQVPFRVGDAIEIEMVAQGGVNSNELEKVRGVVLGRDNRGLGTGVYLRDVVFGEPVERKIALHSPLLRSLKVLEQNFVHKGKRKIKRAKLYYLRDRLPVGTYTPISIL